MIEEKLNAIEGYLLSIKRDTLNGWYELEIGLPKDWIYKGNDVINCEEITKSDKGVLLKVSPKELGIKIDDLITFVELIIDTNSQIVAKEREFTDKMEEVKKKLAEQAEVFYHELDDLREKSFGNFDASDIEAKESTTTQKRGRGRPKGSKNKPKEDVGGKTEQKTSVD
jgi:hypothetical protein